MQEANDAGRQAGRWVGLWVRSLLMSEDPDASITNVEIYGTS